MSLSAIEQLKDSVDGLQAVVDGKLDEHGRRVGNVEDLQKETSDKVVEIKATVTTMEKWLAEVEKRVSRARFGGNGVSRDALIEAIPERMRSTIDLHARFGAKDPIKKAAMESWLKLAAKYQLKAVDDLSGTRKAMHDLSEAMASECSFVASKADMQEGADAEGGYTVPVPLEAEVLRQIENGGVVRPMVRKMPMTAVTHNIPNLATGVTVTIVNEESTIGQTEPTFGQSQLTAKKFAARGIASMELVQDAAIGILDFWLTLVEEQTALLEDTQALEGDGTGSNFTGLIADANVNEVTNGANGAAITHDKLVDQKWKAGKRSTRRRSFSVAWVMNPLVARDVEKLKDSQGAPIWLNTLSVPSLTVNVDPELGGPDGVLLGYPAYTSEQISQTRTVGSSNDCGNIYFGPYGRSMIFGDLLGLVFGVSEHAGGVWEAGQLMARMIKRTAILVGVGADFTKQTGVRAA